MFLKLLKAYTFTIYIYTYEVFVIISDKYYEQMLCIPMNTKAITTTHKLNVYYICPRILLVVNVHRKQLTQHTHIHIHRQMRYFKSRGIV